MAATRVLLTAEGSCTRERRAGRQPSSTALWTFRSSSLTASRRADTACCLMVELLDGRREMIAKRTWEGSGGGRKEEKGD